MSRRTRHWTRLLGLPEGKSRGGHVMHASQCGGDVDKVLGTTNGMGDKKYSRILTLLMNAKKKK